jgi:hypothetical protein
MVVLVTARWMLRALLVLNIVVGLLLLAVPAFTFMQEERFVAGAMKQFPGSDVDNLLTGARWALALVAPVILLAHPLFTALLRMLDTVAAGDPFLSVNADRLRTVAWCLLGIQLCDIGFGIAGAIMDTAAGERISAWSPGLTGWIAVLLVFVLARVFREGARLREEAELTI